MPSEVATPKMVPSSAAMSTASPQRAFDPLAEDRVERGADAQRQVVPVGEVAEGSPISAYSAQPVMP